MAAAGRLAELRGIGPEEPARVGLAGVVAAGPAGASDRRAGGGAARPQTVGGRTQVAGKGVAIVVALDHSSSMKARDFPADGGTRMVSRLDAARATFLQFIEGRPDDLIGLIVFANLPYLICPPTPDHLWLAEQAAAIRPALAGDDGTNIGDAIALGIRDLVDSTPRRKVLVLLTDGQNQPAGAYFKDPQQAAILARDWGVIVHTIAIGRSGGVVRDVDRRTQQATIAEVAGPTSSCSRPWPGPPAASPGWPSTPTRYPPSSARSTTWRRARFAARSYPV